MLNHLESTVARVRNLRIPRDLSVTNLLVPFVKPHEGSPVNLVGADTLKGVSFAGLRQDRRRVSPVVAADTVVHEGPETTSHEAFPPLSPVDKALAIHNRAVLNAFDLGTPEQQEAMLADTTTVPGDLFLRGLIAGELSDMTGRSREEGLELFKKLEGLIEQFPILSSKLAGLAKIAQEKIAILEPMLRQAEEAAQTSQKDSE